MTQHFAWAKSKKDIKALIYLELAFEFTNLQQTSYTVPDFRVWLNIDELAEKLGVLEVKPSRISQSMTSECVFDPTLTSRITLNGECFKTESKKNNRLKVWYTAGCFLLAAAAVATLFLGFFALMPIIFAGIVAFLFAIATTILGTYAFSADEDEVVEDKVVLDPNYIELSTAYDEYFKELSQCQVPGDLRIFLNVFGQPALCQHASFSEWQAAFSAQPGRLGVLGHYLETKPVRQSLSGEEVTAASLLQGDRYIAAKNLSLIVQNNNDSSAIDVLMTVKCLGLLSESNVGKLMAYDISDISAALFRLQGRQSINALTTSPLKEAIFSTLMAADASREGAVLRVASQIAQLYNLPTFSGLTIARQQAFISNVLEERGEDHHGVLLSLSDAGLLNDAACVEVSAIEDAIDQQVFAELLGEIKRKFDVSPDEVLSCCDDLMPYLASDEAIGNFTTKLDEAYTFEAFKTALAIAGEVEDHRIPQPESSSGLW